MNKKINYSEKSLENLKSEVFIAKKSLFNLRFRMASRELLDFSEYRKTRKLVARLQTAINAKKNNRSIYA